MTEASDAGATGASVASTSVFVATFFSLIALIAAFLFLDLALARVDRNESASHAADLYRQGRALLAAGNAHEAGDRFASALANERSNVDYALGLAESMMRDGRSEDAEHMLASTLEHVPNDGAVNLMMARLLERSGRFGDARVYYHRAIFGRWGPDSTQRRTVVRFELVDALARTKDGGAMLAELLPLQATLPDSPAVRRRLAHLFLQAGSPRRAMDILRAFLEHDPRDADAYAGMAEAALALGNFVTARADYAQAIRLQPDDSTLAARSAFADTIVTLDPEARRLSDGQRAVRVQSLLTRALAERNRCRGVATQDAVADSARSLLAVAPPRATDESNDATMQLAAAVWSARPNRCVTAFLPDEVLASILQSLER